MGSLSPLSHLGAMAFACLLVFGVRIQEFDIGELVGLRDLKSLQVYTPIFPGLAKIEQHEIFAPRYAHLKKIVLLGGSPVDSVGCDSTWSHPRRFQKPNAMYGCSIAAQMNEQLRASGVTDWRVFNLARNGAGLTPMVYLYARLHRLRPEVVLYGDDLPFLYRDNADANDLNAGQYSWLNGLFETVPEAKDVWLAYREHLQDRGLRVTPETVSRSARVHAIANGLVFGETDPARTTAGNLLVTLFTRARDNSHAEPPLLPIRYVNLRDWGARPGSGRASDNPDPAFAYSRGLALISILQKAHGGRLLFSVFPSFDRRGDQGAAAFAATLGDYLRQHGASYTSNVELKLRPVYETYDGVHQTLEGNRIIATTLIANLRAEGLIE